MESDILGKQTMKMELQESLAASKTSCDHESKSKKDKWDEGKKKTNIKLTHLESGNEREMFQKYIVIYLNLWIL